MAVGGGGVKGLAFRKTELFWGLFLFVEKIPTAIKPGGGGCKALMALPLRIFFCGLSYEIIEKCSNVNITV